MRSLLPRSNISLMTLSSTAAIAVSLLATFACSSTESAATPTSDAATGHDAAVTVPDAGTQPDAGGDPACNTFRAAVQDGLDAEREKQKVKTATIGVWTERCGSTVFVSNDPKVAVPAKTTDLWRVGSVTKTYVSATTLRLAEQKKLSIDETIDKWLPDFPRASTIKVRHLMNHTSGIFNYTDTSAFADAITKTPKKDFTPEDLIAWANAETPTNAPGAAVNYSNTNYIVLGRIIELVTGEKVAAVLRREAMVPAGLTHTFLAGAEPTTGDFAHGFSNASDVTDAFSLSVPWTAGAMATSAEDMLLWLRALYIDKKIVNADSYADMTANVLKSGYGLGVQIFPADVTAGLGPGVGHTGGIAGYATQAFAFPDSATAVTSIVGSSTGNPNPLSVVALNALMTLREAP